MALFHECTPQCAQKELDTADIVRDAIFQQVVVPTPINANMSILCSCEQTLDCGVGKIAFQR
jgi:hypothetical protein